MGNSDGVGDGTFKKSRDWLQIKGVGFALGLAIRILGVENFVENLGKGRNLLVGRGVENLGGGCRLM